MIPLVLGLSIMGVIGLTAVVFALTDEPDGTPEDFWSPDIDDWP